MEIIGAFITLFILALLLAVPVGIVKSFFIKLIKCPNCSIKVARQKGIRQFCNRCKYTWSLEASISTEKQVTETIQEKRTLCADCGKYYSGNPNFCPSCGIKL